jgi:hypothetical protein
MALFYRSTFGVSLFLVALVTAVYWIGNQSPSPLASLFTDPEGRPCQMPCLLGIQPGQTTHVDAVRLVRTHPFTRHFVPLTKSAFSGEHFTLVLAGSTNNRVSDVVLVRDFSAPKLAWGSFGDTVAVLGGPDRFQVARDRRGDHITTVYLKRHLVATFKLRTPFYSDADLQSIFVAAWQPIVSTDMSAWAGFGKHYPILGQFP